MKCTVDHMLKWLRWLIAAMAYAFLCYKLATYNDYTSIRQLISDATWRNWLWFVGALLLMPVNLLLESMKWRVLISPVHRATIHESVNMVFWGQTGAFFTPNRLGEFPTRVMLMSDGTRATSIALGFVGSLAQTICISIFGIIGFHFFSPYFFSFFAHNEQFNAPHIPITLYISIVALLLLLYFTFPYIINKVRQCKNATLKKIQEVSGNITFTYLFKVIILSTLRYFVFCLQSFFMYHFCFVDIPINIAIFAIPTFYLFVTYTPSISVSEIAIRGSYAAFIMRCCQLNDIGAILASSFIWVINFCLPMLLGSAFVKHNHKNRQ
ncbi:MAG: lysylphosphatidylglycerol synthase domain-containing protein [Bacteroidales bacterium]|nr:lysylphosphatidylglycerol synthase domain-containing protein [Bacteroidales bacterium]